MKAPSYLMQINLGPLTANEQAVLIEAIPQLRAEDEATTFVIQGDTHMCILRGMSETQLDLAVSRLRSEFGLNVTIGAPEVAYRERLKRRSDIDYTHKKQLGGKRQFARVRMLFEPNEMNAGNRLDMAPGAAELPEDYYAGAKGGFESALNHGLLAGFPVVDVKATLLDSAWHEHDSSVLAFEIAARAATREALQKGGCVLMEPIMRLEIATPLEYEGSVKGDMEARRGEIIERAVEGETLTVVALAPLANLFGYHIQLRSFTQRRGEHRMEFSHYAEAPPETPPNPGGTFPPAIGMRRTA